jgi:hypothetical protein
MQRMSELVKDDDTAYGLQTRKYSLVGLGIHNDLNKPGFPATHDSPIRHEGKFDWRKHKGKGEGNAAFGAGTYLSTSDGVHRNYKEQFTKKNNGYDVEHEVTINGVTHKVTDDPDYGLMFDGAGTTPAERMVAEHMLDSGGRSMEEGRKLAIAGIKKLLSSQADDWGSRAGTLGPIAEYVKNGAAIPDNVIAQMTDEQKKLFRAHLWNRNVEYVNGVVADVEALKPNTISVKIGRPNRTPTYEVSVNIEPHQILDWDKTVLGQAPEVERALREALATRIEYRQNERAALAAEHDRMLDKIFAAEEELHSATDNQYPDGSWQSVNDDVAQKRVDAMKAELKDITLELERVERFEQLLKVNAYRSGGSAYRILATDLGSQSKASDLLQAHGILGHKYKASGGTDDKYPNYVIYDDSKIETNYVHFSDQRVYANSAGPVNRQAVEEHINKVLGGTVRTFWPQLSVMDWAGDYTHVQKLIRISVQSLNPMSVAYHESMHAFVANMRDMGATDVVAALEKAAASPHMITQVREFFKNEPEVLKQLSDPEERVAYMYQLWASGHLNPTPQARGIFQKMAAFFRKLLGVWSNDQRALHIMEYFNSGEYAKGMDTPNAVHRAMMAPGRNKAYETAAGFTKGLADLAETLFATGSARVRETGVPALRDIADAVKRQDKDTRGGTRGFVHASRLAATKMRTDFASRLDEHVTADRLREAIEALQTNTRAPSPEARNTVRAVRAQLKEARQYMLDAGAYVGDLGPEYFPRVWDIHYISKNQQAFRDMLEPYVRSGQFGGDVDKLIKKLVASEGHEFSVETDMPGMQFTKQRILGFITDADAAEFLNKDLLETMHSYLTQAARRAEWFRLFGNGKLDAMLSRARKEGATQEQIETTEQYLKGINGTLGDNISPALRRLYGNTIVYQNVRLLPLAVFSSLVDPMGVMVRGGTARDAWSTFTRGIREIPIAFKKKRGKPGQAEEIAELVGVIDSAMLNHITSDMYTQGMVGGTAKKINTTFFKYNLMEGLNRSYRVGATEAALKFIAKHADGTASRHSQRWIKELGLDPSDVVKYKDRIALTTAEGLTPEAEVRLHAAINQWVDGAVLRPDAADKPIWMNDPHYAIFSHLKQFIYSFQKTIIERTVHEFKNGNYTPAMALASYVPMMIASDFIKGMIQGGGSQPDWKKDWGPVEYVGYGVQRAGLLGVGQFGVDAYENMSRGGLGVTALGGPAIEQLVDVLGTLSGRNEFGDVALDALPANALYSEAIGPGR